MKECKRCKENKSIDKYYKNKSTIDGLSFYCKSCTNIRHKVYLQTKKGKIASNKNSRKWRKENRDYQHHLNKNYQYKHKGVYGLFENGQCLYVGESIQIFGRWGYHKAGIKNPYKEGLRQPELYKNLYTHKNIIFGIIEECDNHKEREQYWIDYYQPKYNG